MEAQCPPNTFGLHKLSCKQLSGLAERTVGHTRGCNGQQRPSLVVMMWPLRAILIEIPAHSIIGITCGPCRMVRWPRPSRSCGAAAASSRTHSASRRTPAASGAYRPTPADNINERCPWQSGGGIFIASAVLPWRLDHRSGLVGSSRGRQTCCCRPTAPSMGPASPGFSSSAFSSAMCASFSTSSSKSSDAASLLGGVHTGPVGALLHLHFHVWHNRHPASGH
jgi:hypothetical protein